MRAPPYWAQMLAIGIGASLIVASFVRTGWTIANGAPAPQGPDSTGREWTLIAGRGDGLGPARVYGVQLDDGSWLLGARRGPA